MSTLKIAMIGNVDSGKSTLTSILTRGGLDDGRGSARQLVFVHPHEKESGRTSSIGMEFVQLPERNVCLIDLCGHERYLKTTLFGLNLFRPHYCLLLVGANMGVSRMTRQHFNTVMALGYPTIVVLTKLDISPKHVVTQTVADIKTMAKRYRQTVVDIDHLTDNFPLSPVVAMMTKVSNVTGQGLDSLRHLLTYLSTHTPSLTKEGDSSLTTTADSGSLEFLVDNTYQVKGVGTVISGFVQTGQVKLGEKYQLCLTHQQQQIEVTVKGIRNEHDQPIPVATEGRHVTVLIKDPTKNLRRENIRRGNILLSHENCELSREFEAGVYIFHHKTTLRGKSGKKNGYQCIVNCNGVRQSAELVAVNNTNGILRSHSRNRVRFRFVYHSEYVKPGTVFTFREGSTIGVGKIIST